MTNGEKYQTADERAKAFDVYCRKVCTDEGGSCNHAECAFTWLGLEAEEVKPLPCPFCGGTDVVMQDVGGFELACQGCGFTTPAYMEKEKLISEYQRVARAVMAAEEDGNGDR